MQVEKSQEECNNQKQNDDLLDHWPKWSLSEHEAEESCHEHRIYIERRCPVDTAAHEVSGQNELNWGHSQTGSKYEPNEQYQVS